MAERQEETGEKQVGFKTVQLLKSENLGIGSYGSVCKAQCDKLLCAAKILHPTLCDPIAHRQIASKHEHRLPFKRFEQECEFMSAIRHPNIVQYLGMHQDPETRLPVLLMELMDDSLTHFLESSQKAVPYHIQVNFCHDITLALSFLHSNGIIHRDLSSNNVLLRGNVHAKVTDFGMAKLSDTTPERTRSFTLCPGTDSFMPPEAAKNIPEYTEKIDCFSFGVVIIQILTQKFPKPSDRLKEVRTVDPQFPGGSVEVRVPEVERRQSHIKDIDEENPLLVIALDCLKDREVDRPSSQDLCDRVVALKGTAEYAESVRNVEEREERLRDELKQQHETEINDLKDEHVAEINGLKDEHALLVNDIKLEHDKQLEQKDDTITMQQEDIVQRTKEKLQLTQQLQAKDEEIARIQREHSQELQIKTQALTEEKRKNRDLLERFRKLEKHHATEISDLHRVSEQQITERDKTIAARQQEIQALKQEHNQQIKDRDDTIAARQREIQKLKLELNQQIKERDDTIEARQQETQLLREETQKLRQEYDRQIKDQDDIVAARQREIQKLQLELNQQIKERDDTIEARQQEMQRLRQQHAQQIKDRDDTIAARQQQELKLQQDYHSDKSQKKWLGLSQLQKTLNSVSKKWYQLGFNLGLSFTELHEFDKPDYGSAEDRLEAMLKALLEKDGSNINAVKLVNALRKIEEVELAEKLAEQNGVTVEQPSTGATFVPDYKTQKTEFHAVLQQRLKKHDTWYLVDVRWMKQWMKYVGYDQWDRALQGQETANPGPVDNSKLFEDPHCETKILRQHLMEELDYYLLPEGAWNKLTAWYGVTQDSRPISRRVVDHGLYMKHLKVEVYLLEFKLCLHPNVNETRTKPFSRVHTVAGLEAAMKVEFNIPKEAECRVWHRYMTHTYVLLSTPSQTLQDAGLYNGQTIVLEKKNDDGSWPRQSQKSSSSQHPTRSSDDTFSSAASKTSSASSYSSSSYYSPYFHKPGLCGLSNLGNTCFMNAALQCLSNTHHLTDYFLGTKAGYKPYKKHINKDNPLGTGGAIAEAYGALLEDLWSGKTIYVAPQQFKTQVGRYAPQFVGYAQHDSQELLAFLLNGLHEDLNLVIKKPHVDMTVKTEGRPEWEIAEETWMKYLQRNQSVIVRVFQGQLKSTLVCPDCQTLSKVFDPFTILSLPLPIKKTRTIFVTVVRDDPNAALIKYKLKIPKRGCVLDLKKELGKLSKLDYDDLVIVDVYNSRFHRIYGDRDSLSHILERDDIFAYELGAEKSTDNVHFVHVPIYHRETTEKVVRYSYQSYTQKYSQLFGIPTVVRVPQECTYRQLYDAIYKRCSRYLLSWKQATEASGRQAREGVEDDSDLFQLVVVNSYGSQDVKRLEDTEQRLNLSSQNYIACDWKTQMKERCYLPDIAETVEQDESCKDVPQVMKKNINLLDCLNLFIEKETLSKDDAWFCPECKEFVQALKKFDLWKLPEILVIHLKRFSYDRYWRDKLDVLVEFPVNGLNLSDYVLNTDDPDEPLYDLYAVSNHFVGMGGGHYTAYAKNNDTGKWYNFDDNHFSETSEDRLVTSAAYVLFYQRRPEGPRPTRPILDRSLGQSFADERRQLKAQYQTTTYTHL